MLKESLYLIYIKRNKTLKIFAYLTIWVWKRVEFSVYKLPANIKKIMKLLNLEEFEIYIKSNYECFAESERSSISQEIPGTCDSCSRDVFLKIFSSAYDIPYRTDNKLSRFVNIFIYNRTHFYWNERHDIHIRF